LTQNLPARIEPATGSTILPYIIEHIAKRFFQPLPVDPEPDFLADLLGAQHVRFVKDFEVMRHRGTGQRRDGGNLAHVEAFAPVEQQQDALAVLIAQGREHTSHRLPFGRDGRGVGVEKFHVDKFSYIDMKSQHPKNQVFSTDPEREHMG